MGESSYSRATSHILLLILLVYLALATLFAVKTPPWQNPDEPAHYNYIADVAAERLLPLLEEGDYDGAYLERLKSEKFPPGLSIAPLRYESHQPPLYYVLSAPVFWVSGGSLLALRLFGVVLGSGVVLMVFLCARVALPNSSQIGLGAAAFAAFLPMHIAVMASVNNDALAELVIAGAILALLCWQRAADAGKSGEESRGNSHCLLLVTGILIGAGFLTKATAYILLPVALFVVVGKVCWQMRGQKLSLKGLFTQFALVTAPALALGLPWWIRNSQVYGAWDLLGLARHDIVVTGQTTAATWIAENGWSAYWERAWTFTSKSFWGVFGWLGVFVDARVYTALQVVSVMAVVGVVFWCWHRRSGGNMQWPSLLSMPWTPLVLLWLGAFAAYAWYNLGFMQHQGRYLFPALPAWSLFFALGWWAVLGKRVSVVAGGVLLAIAATRFLFDMASGGFDRWALLLFGAAGIGLLVHGLFLTPFAGSLVEKCGVRWASPEPLRHILFVGLFAALVGLDIAIPFLYIVPQLGA